MPMSHFYVRYAKHKIVLCQLCRMCYMNTVGQTLTVVCVTVWVVGSWRHNQQDGWGLWAWILARSRWNRAADEARRRRCLESRRRRLDTRHHCRVSPNAATALIHLAAAWIHPSPTAWSCLCRCPLLAARYFRPDRLSCDSGHKVYTVKKSCTSSNRRSTVP
jgi:hypothetical protein